MNYRILWPEGTICTVGEWGLLQGFPELGSPGKLFEDLNLSSIILLQRDGKIVIITRVCYE